MKIMERVAGIEPA